MGTRTNAGRLLASLAAATLLAACSASPTPAPATPAATPTAAAPAATPAATPTAAAPAVTPTPAAVYGPVAVVAGSSSTCQGTTGTETTDAQGVVRRRGGTVSCTATVNDPRVSGKTEDTLNIDGWGDPSTAGAAVMWGTARLTNEQGSWKGTYTGVWDSVHGDTIAAWYTGSGAYSGLSYFELLTGFEPYTIRGQIQPGDPPIPVIAPAVAAVTPPPAAVTNPTAAPSPLSYGPVAVVEGWSRSAGTWGDFGLVSTDADGVQHWRGMVSYVHEMNDPRVSGTDVTDLNMDGWERPEHGAAIQWGSTRLTNEEGAWTGTFTGVFDSVRGDTFVAWLTGSGAYAGLTYFLATAPEARFLGGDLIELQGQIYPGMPPQP